MSNDDKMIIEKLTEAIRVMSEMEKGYLLGVAETRLAIKQEHLSSSSKVDIVTA